MVSKPSLCIVYSNVTIVGNVVFQKIPTITQDLSTRSIATSRESVSTYPRRPKAEASSDAVDVVKRLCDLIDPSTERMAPPLQHTFSSMMSHELLIQLSVTGEFHQHDGVVTVMMKLPAQGFA